MIPASLVLGIWVKKVSFTDKKVRRGFMGARARIVAEGDDSGWLPPLPLLALQLA